MLRYCLVTLLLVLIADQCFSQTVEGTVLENGSKAVLGNIDVQNLRTGQHTPTDKNGRFSISARINDLLVLSGFNYKPDTVMITDLKPKEIYLEPVSHLLNEVKVNANNQVNKQAVAVPFDPDYHNQTINYQRNLDGPYANGALKGGVNIRFWASKSEEHKRQKEAQLIQNDVISTEIGKVFDPENIAKYVPLKDKALQAFIIRYTPDIKTYKAPGFNLAAYLNGCYQEFIKLPEAERQKVSIFN